MSRILFFDPICPAPYDQLTLSRQAMGGTEASVVRVAEALDASVVQHNRRQAEGRYCPPAARKDVEHVVVLRDPQLLPVVSQLYPNAKLSLWIHDLIDSGSKRAQRLAKVTSVLPKTAITIVCVSEFQRAQVEQLLGRQNDRRCICTHTIYNPIDEALNPDDTPVDRSKLVFFSSPDKALGYTLDAFRELRQQLPELRLCIANPGYLAQHSHTIPGVEWLGALPHASIIHQLRSALCVFYPNFLKPETFGLVFAESNAAGTPVLTHDCGAASEVLHDPAQTLPVSLRQRVYASCMRSVPSSFRARAAHSGHIFTPYLECIAAWRVGARPKVQADPRFRIGAIAKDWLAFFASRES